MPFGKVLPIYKVFCLSFDVMAEGPALVKCQGPLSLEVEKQKGKSPNSIVHPCAVSPQGSVDWSAMLYMFTISLLQWCILLARLVFPGDGPICIWLLCLAPAATAEGLALVPSPQDPMYAVPTLLLGRAAYLPMAAASGLQYSSQRPSNSAENPACDGPTLLTGSQHGRY